MNRAPVAPGSEMSSNPEGQRHFNRRQTEPTARAATRNIQTTTITEETATTAEAPRLEASVVQVQTDLTFVLTERDELIGMLNDYEARVQNMDLDFLRN